MNLALPSMMATYSCFAHEGRGIGHDVGKRKHYTQLTITHQRRRRVDYWRVGRQASSLAGQPLMLRVLYCSKDTLHCRQMVRVVGWSASLKFATATRPEANNTSCNCCTVGNFKGVFKRHNDPTLCLTRHVFRRRHPRGRKRLQHYSEGVTTVNDGLTVTGLAEFSLGAL